MESTSTCISTTYRLLTYSHTLQRTFVYGMPAEALTHGPLPCICPGAAPQPT